MLKKGDIMKALHALALTLTITSLIGCSSQNSEKFLGCYAFQKGQRSDLRIETKDGKFFVSIREGDGWKNIDGLHVGTEKELSQLFGSDSKKIKANLVGDKGPFGIFNVKEGEVYGGKQAQSEYISFLMNRGGSLYKVKCEN